MPPTSRLSLKIASATKSRQSEIVCRLDNAGLAIDDAVADWWHRLWTLSLGEAVAAMGLLPHLLRMALVHRFTRLARWTRQHTAQAIIRTLPDKYLAVALAQGPRPVREDVSPAVKSFLALVQQSLTEDDIADLLFPPVPLEQTQASMLDLLRRAEFAGDGNRVPPERLIGTVAAGMAAGKGQRQIAADLLPLVNNVRASAMRVARTWGMHVAQQEQERTHAELGDLVIGYQVHASIDKWTRPWHAARSGTIYYLDPKAGQKGMEQCPHPPLEAEDASERPTKAPKIAWNCRCFISPILRPI